jgi:mRNA-degrading endonuclease toxin of MazEF toxin-antitoxin module
MRSTNTVGSEQEKDRPYVIMSRNSVNDLGINVVGVPLSTQVHKASAYRIKLPVSEFIKDPSSDKPVQEGVALTDQIRVLDTGRLMQKVGRLSDSAIISVGLGLSFLFDIS